MLEMVQADLQDEFEAAYAEIGPAAEPCGALFAGGVLHIHVEQPVALLRGDKSFVELVQDECPKLNAGSPHMAGCMQIWSTGVADVSSRSCTRSRLKYLLLAHDIGFASCRRVSVKVVAIAKIGSQEVNRRNILFVHHECIVSCEVVSLLDFPITLDDFLATLAHNGDVHDLSVVASARHDRQCSPQHKDPLGVFGIRDIPIHGFVDERDIFRIVDTRCATTEEELGRYEDFRCHRVDPRTLISCFNCVCHDLAAGLNGAFLVG